MKCFNKESAPKRLVAVLLLAVICFTLVLGACNKDGATPDQAQTDAVDTQNFEFSQGIIIGGADVSGMAFDAAFQTVEAAVADSIADFELTVKAEDESFKYGKDDFTYNFLIVEALNEAAVFCEDKEKEATSSSSATVLAEFDVKAEVVTDSVAKVVDAVAKKVDVKAVDSTFTVDGDDVVISREKTGKKLDKEDLNKKITEEVNKLIVSGEKATVKAVVNDIEPKYNLEGLDGEIKLISTYTTYSTNTLDADHNMALALSACNGSVINPGEVWSFNACTGDSNLESLGYRPATVIMNGKFEQGIGGGICQASTTIYNAAIMANMEIVERYCHAYQSSYVPAGRDATIDYPNLDLKLSNPTDYPMYMQCYMEDAYLTVNIFGWDDPAFDNIEIESSVYGATKVDYRASAWRVYYLDGKEVGREELPLSIYDYPKDDDEEETTKATKPKTTKPKTTKPKATKPKETKPATQAPTTKPQETVPATTQPTDPVEITTAPVNTQPTDATSVNQDQIPTATVNY